MVKLSDYVFRFITDLGVKHVFMLAGGGAMHLNDSLGRCREIEFVCNLHEQAAAIAAEAYARVTNNLGVALVTTGPGGTNAITGVAGAWLESTPCLFISGQVKRADMRGGLGVRQLGIQELDIVSIVRTITKYAVTVTDPLSIRYHLEKAVAMAKSGRPGPTWVDIPLDVQATQIDPNNLTGYQQPPFGQSQEETSALRRQVGHTIELLNNSERPVMLIGNGIRIAEAQKDLVDVVDVIGIPVLSTWMGADLLTDDHPLYFGKPGTVASRGANFILQNSDCLISMGARLDFAVTGYDQAKFARAAKKIVVDIDLSEIRKLKFDIDVAVAADAKLVLREILKQEATIRARNRIDWLERCTEWQRRYSTVLPEYWEQKQYVNSYVSGRHPRRRADR